MTDVLFYEILLWEKYNKEKTSIEAGRFHVVKRTNTAVISSDGTPNVNSWVSLFFTISFTIGRRTNIMIKRKTICFIFLLAKLWIPIGRICSAYRNELIKRPKTHMHTHTHQTNKQTTHVESKFLFVEWESSKVMPTAHAHTRTQKIKI